MRNNRIRGDVELVLSGCGVGFDEDVKRGGRLLQRPAPQMRNHAVPARLNSEDCVFSFEGSYWRRTSHRMTMSF